MCLSVVSCLLLSSYLCHENVPAFVLNVNMGSFKQFPLATNAVFSVERTVSVLTGPLHILYVQLLST